MLLSHSHKFIFIHVPKTGGASINRVLQPFSDVIWSWNIAKGCDEKSERTHTGAQEVRKTYFNEFDKYFVFGFIREPYLRARSWYLYAKHSADVKAKFPVEYQQANVLSFEDWVEGYYCSQSDLIRDENGNLIVDYIGLYETINFDFQAILKKIGLEEMQLPHDNRGIDAAIAWNPKVYQFLHAKFPQDYDLYARLRDHSLREISRR